MNTLKSIAVFCGSNNGTSPEYCAMAGALGNRLAAEGIRLVYGGGNMGVMGELARAVMAGGGSAIGVIPERLNAVVDHIDLTELQVVSTMHERKQRMYDLADAFIILPGGIGTMEEMMEVWTMNQLSEIDKPVGLLDIENFFAPFLAFIDHMVATKFLPAAHRYSICVDPEPAALLDKLRRFQKTDVPKWL